MLLCKRNPKHFITMNNSWVHHYIPEPKRESSQWTVKGEPVLRKAKTVSSTVDHIMLTCLISSNIKFWRKVLDYLKTNKFFPSIHSAVPLLRWLKLMNRALYYGPVFLTIQIWSLLVLNLFPNLKKISFFTPYFVFLSLRLEIIHPILVYLERNRPIGRRLFSLY